MTGPNHILVVDDDTEIRDLLKRFLSRNGFRVSAIADGPGMRAALGESKFDLVVLDVMWHPPQAGGAGSCRLTAPVAGLA